MLTSALVAGAASAVAAECPGNPDALGVSRVLVVDPTEHGRIGTMQYPESLPLDDKEVVITFDDGPLPPYTKRVLEALGAECVKATFFMVGRQARAYPDWVRRVYNEGHTVASHSQNHPLIFTNLPVAAAEKEIELGMASVTAALGDPRALAPFFRFPGLGRSHAIEAYLTSRDMMTWSADFPADDWTHISAQAVMARALERLTKKGKGVLLLHDIQPATALMLPQLLRELKKRGFHVVHIVPAGPDRPKTLTEPESWVMRKPSPQAHAWPRVIEADTAALPAPSAKSFGWPRPFSFARSAPPPSGITRILQGPAPLPAWSPAPRMDIAASEDSTIVPDLAGLSFADPHGPVTADTTPVSVDPTSWVVSSDDVFGEMVAPSAWAPRPKAKPHTPKVRLSASMPAGHAAALKPTPAGAPRPIVPTTR